MQPGRERPTDAERAGALHTPRRGVDVPPVLLLRPTTTSDSGPEAAPKAHTIGTDSARLGVPDRHSRARTVPLPLINTPATWWSPESAFT